MDKVPIDNWFSLGVTLFLVFEQSFWIRQVGLSIKLWAHVIFLLGTGEFLTLGEVNLGVLSQEPGGAKQMI